jgi:lincosamide nucleotidyltransferase A/C/D/E
MFSAERVLDVLNQVPEAVVDGGWGVDALLGSQSRGHDDLDLVVPLDSCDRIVARLRALGFERHLDERPTRVAVEHGDEQVDLHLVAPAEFGMVQTLPGGSTFTYVLDDTHGTIAGQRVPCLSAPMQVLTHCGYEPDADDRADMALVAAASGEALPPPYAELDELRLRPATLQDMAAFVVVRWRSWRAAYTGLMPQGLIAAMDLGAGWVNWSSAIRVPPTPSVRVTVAGPPGAVHGFSVVSGSRDDDASDAVGEVRLLYVDPTAWSKGVGAALLSHAVETLRGLGFRELRLWTLRENERARSFYERSGWRADGAEQTVEQPQGSYVEVRYRLLG